VIVWAALGPVFHYSDTWQLVINTGTAIVTLLMVFRIRPVRTAGLFNAVR
jgi:low affinity Fe/Cu permease